jgi:MFS family permease
MAFGSASFFVFMANYITVSISPLLVTIVTNFNISLTRASYLLTVNLLLLGLGNLFWVPLSEKIGKRPVLVLCSGLFFISTIWAAVAGSYGSLLGARAVQGFTASVSEGLGPVIVGDVYFLHERGLWVGVNILAYTGGTSLGGIFSGLIANANPDWHWVYWHQVVLTGALFLVTVLFQPETNFNRPLENEAGEGLPSSQLPELQARAKSSWIKSLGVTSWYNRYASSLLLQLHSSSGTSYLLTGSSTAGISPFGGFCGDHSLPSVSQPCGIVSPLMAYAWAG